MGPFKTVRAENVTITKGDPFSWKGLLKVTFHLYFSLKALYTACGTESIRTTTVHNYINLALIVMMHDSSIISFY